MKLRFLKRRWQRRTARTLAVLIALILIAAFIINLYWTPILARTFKNSVLKSTDSLYTVKFADADLHVLQGKIVIYDLDLIPDTVLFNQRKKVRSAPNNLYHLHIKKIVLRHIHPLSLYFRRVLNIGEVVLSEPDLQIDYDFNHKQDVAVDPRTLYQRISNTFKFIYIGHIALNDVKFKYSDHSGNKVAVSQLQEMNLDATELLIDSTTQTQKGRFLYCKDIKAELNNFTGKTLNGLYQYKMKLLKLSSRASQLNAEGLSITPISPDEFFKRSHRDRFTVQLDSVQLNNFDFLNYHKYRTLNASSMIISKGSINVYSNPLLKTHADSVSKAKKIDKSGTFPNSALFKINQDMKIDTILLKNLNISYTELNAKSHKIGTAVFNHTRGRVLNVTTNKAALKKDSTCLLSLTTYFMNKSKLDVDFNFKLTDTTHLGYTYSGHLDSMDLAAINPAMMPLGMVKINSGTLKGFDFDMTGDIKHTKGRVTVLYNDLKVTLLLPDTIEQKLKHLTLASMYANIFILKHDNPDAAGKPERSFVVDYKRDVDYTFFKGIWKTLLTGIRQTVGYSEDKEKQIKSQMMARANDKKEHKEIKAERKEQKAEKKAAKDAAKATAKPE